MFLKSLYRHPTRFLKRCYSESGGGRGPEHPMDKTLRIIRNDMRTLLSYFTRKSPEYKNYDSVSKELDSFPRHSDIVIIGGGVIGSSIAYHLKDRVGRGLEVTVIEKDPTYKKASTVLSVGGLRQQFSLPENIKMSQYAAAFFKDIKKYLGSDVDLQFTPHGYLLLATDETASQLEANFNLQQDYGVKNELLTPSLLKSKYPWLNMEGIVLGCRGLENEGWFDPWALLNGFKKKAIEIGVKYIHGEVTGFNFELIPHINSEMQPYYYESIQSINVMTSIGEERDIEFSQAILAAGAESGEIAKKAKIGTGKKLLSVALPVEPRKRYVYCFNCTGDNAPGLNTPMTFDPSGTYFRREGLGNNYIAGKAPTADKEPDVSNLDVDYNFFDTDIWPHLANRVPAFEAIKVNSAWAGYYEFNSFDENGIIGLHPHYHNFSIATGFSGHGIQQATAVGKAMTELILDGEFSTIDLSRLGFNRILLNKPMLETNIF